MQISNTVFVDFRIQKVFISDSIVGVIYMYILYSHKMIYHKVKTRQIINM